MFCFIPKLQNYKNVRSYIEYHFSDWKKWQELRELLFINIIIFVNRVESTFQIQTLNYTNIGLLMILRKNKLFIL